MDFLTLEPSKGYGNVLVVTDHFTKYALAIPTKNQTAKTTADALYQNFILHYGIPTNLHSDQGANFESELIRELCNIMGIKKTRTTPYHPMGNGCTERYNRTLLNMLGTLDPSKKSNWKDYIAPLTYAYNCTKHESTKVAPFELMFGRTPKLPIDSTFETIGNENQVKTPKTYIDELKEHLQITHEIARKHLEKARGKQKSMYDRRAKASKLTVGDHVLVKILKHDGKHKIQDKYEEDPYEVIEQTHPGIPVFRIRSKKGKEKVIHRNHLLPFITEDKETTVPSRPVPKPRRMSINQDNVTLQKKEVIEVVEDRDVTDTDSDSDDVAHTCHSGDARKKEGRESRRSRNSSSTDTRAAADEVDTVAPVSETETEEDTETEKVVVNGTDDVETDPEITENTQQTEEENDTEEAEEQVTEPVDEVDVPVVLRRSSRESKPPDRYKNYHMYSMTAGDAVRSRPRDARMHALSLFINSGIADQMDSDMVDRMLNSVMK